MCVCVCERVRERERERERYGWREEARREKRNGTDVERANERIWDMRCVCERERETIYQTRILKLWSVLSKSQRLILRSSAER